MTATIGKRYTDSDYHIKWGVIGAENTGKTHFGVSAAQLRQNKKVLYFNLEPPSNLIPVLKKFPDVHERTEILPTDEDEDRIAEMALRLDPTEKKSAYGAALAYYITDKVKELFFQERKNIRDYFIVVDTASQVYQKLMWETLDEREANPELKKLGALIYGEPKREFSTMVDYLAKMPTDVIWLGRTKPAGEEYIDPETNKKKWRPIPGKEAPEWKDMLRYQASVILHLTRKEEPIMDGTSFRLDSKGKPRMREVRYGKITKHKSGRIENPIITDPTPVKVMAWLRGLDIQSTQE